MYVCMYVCMYVWVKRSSEECIIDRRKIKGRAKGKGRRYYNKKGRTK